MTVELSGIVVTQKINDVTRAQREGLCRLLKAFPLTLTGFAPWDQAIVTSGGVSVKEVDPKTMRSKKAENLYLAGEILDVDAYTGGFNLQIAWSTGFCAGQAAAKGEKES